MLFNQRRKKPCFQIFNTSFKLFLSSLFIPFPFISAMKVVGHSHAKMMVPMEKNSTTLHVLLDSAIKIQMINPWIISISCLKSKSIDKRKHQGRTSNIEDLNAYGDNAQEKIICCKYMILSFWTWNFFSENLFKDDKTAHLFIFNAPRLHYDQQICFHVNAYLPPDNKH